MSTTTLAPCHWPGLDSADLPLANGTYPGGEVPLARIDPASLESAVAQLKRNRRFIEDRPVSEIISILDRVAERWLDREQPIRQQAVDWLHRTTGLAPSMLGGILHDTFGAVRAPYLTALVQQELGALEVFDVGVATEYGRRHAIGPQLTWLIGGGIVPNATVAPLVSALLCRSTVLVKCPTREPTFAGLLAQSIAEEDANLGGCIAAGWWPGGSGAHDAVAAAAADTVICTGTDETLDAVRQRVRPEARFLGYGDRVSVIAVGKEHLSAGNMALMWTNLAEAVGLYDQHGCLSPHVIYVEEGGELAPREAAERIADAMSLYESKAPRGPISSEVAAALATRKQRADVRAVDDSRAAIWTSSGSEFAWTVTYDDDPTFERSPGYRYVAVKPVYDLEDIPTLLKKSDHRFQAIALEAPDARRKALTAEFHDVGISRVCSTRDLQRPPIGWPRDGRQVLGSLVTWADA